MGQQFGGSLPKALAVKAGLEEGSEIDIDVEKGHLVIKPKAKTLEELLSQITLDNLHSEIQTGKTQGREIW